VRSIGPLVLLVLVSIVGIGGKCTTLLVAPVELIHELITLPSAAQPANTPGTPGVDPTLVGSANLVTQFGGTGFSLNNAQYTRWRLNELATPDAILIVIAGFGGGVNNYKVLAENLIWRVQQDHGLVLEVWGFHRRTNQLEDRIGVLVSQLANDPLIALDWYYGTELGLTLHPVLAGTVNRRAFFHNTSSDVPFLANWTSHVFSQDIDAVVDAALAVASNGNVFLAGHSAGTGFVARYAATDFDATGLGPVDAGYAKLRGLVLLEGGGGSTAGAPLSEDSLDRIEAKFDGGLFAAVRNADGRCVDGATACSVATEAVDCMGQTPAVCTPAVSAYSAIAGLSPRVVAAAEPSAVQGRSDRDTGQVIIQVDQGAPGNNAVTVVPDLVLLGASLPDSTVDGLFGQFLDDDGLTATFLSPAVATSLGGPGPVVGGLQTWQDITEGPLPAEPNLGPAPTALPAPRWGQELEISRVDRLRETFIADGANASDWYYATSGLSTTSVSGVCGGGGTCIAGDVGASCTSNGECSQFISLDSTQLSADAPTGRGRRDIVNLTQAGNIDIPVICFGGSNGLTPVPGVYTAFGQSLGVCTAPSCTGVARVFAPNFPNPAFPLFDLNNGLDAGFEVHISEGYAHNDIISAEDDATNHVVGPLSDFIARNAQ